MNCDADFFVWMSLLASHANFAKKSFYQLESAALILQKPSK